MEIKIGDLPPARGDRTLLRQVLSNLLGNAVKFTRKKDKAIIEVNGFNSGEFNTYCIKDNGAGFDMRYYNILFEIFRRLHGEKEYEGTGVGLAIVKKIIQRHGGSIWAEGKPGEGATFCFTLPAVMKAQE
jgi:light-regulated signal transduction histidine kinase (bacteriophytochrome)